MRTQSGLSYIESLVATTLIAIVLVPALEALQGGQMGAAVHERNASLHYRVAGRMEELLAQPFSDLEAAAGSPTVPGALSDAAGTSDRRLVYIARWDADDADGDGNRFTGADDGLLWVRVQIADTPVALNSLASW